MYNIESMIGFAFVLMRMSGCIFFNPILGRRNFPAIVKVGFALILALLIYSVSPVEVSGVTTATEYAILLLKEFFIGYVIGFVITIFTGVIILGGEIIDYQIGLTMSKIYDPQSNFSMSLNATMYNILFLFLFFVANGHLNLIQIFISSSEIIPYGQVAITQEITSVIIDMFCQSLVLAVKLSLPILAMEFLLEMGVGILMKAIPQINVFVINLQAKLLLGIILLAIFFAPIANFLENLIVIMFDSIENIMIFMK